MLSEEVRGTSSAAKNKVFLGLGSLGFVDLPDLSRPSLEWSRLWHLSSPLSLLYNVKYNFIYNITVTK